MLMGAMPKSRGLAWIYVVSCAVVYGLSCLPVPQKPIGDPTQLTDSAKVTLDLIVSMNALMGTLNTAMFGAAGALAIKGQEWSSRWTYIDGLLVMCALLCGAASYYGIYLCHIQLVGMAASGYFSAGDFGVDRAMKIQYYATVLGFFLVGLVFTRMLESRGTTGPAKQG